MKQDITFLCARIIGPIMIVLGAAFITQPTQMLEALGSSVFDDAMRVSGAVIGMGLGLIIAVLHNRWDSITAILISVLGWASLLRGAVFLLLPNLAEQAYVIVNSNPMAIPIVGCAIALIGVWLGYAGYIAGTLRADR